MASINLSMTIVCSPKVLVQAAHMVLRYLKRASRQGILFPSKGSFKFKAFHILIGPAVKIQGGQSPVTWSFLGMPLFPGEARSNRQSLRAVQIQKQSTFLWQWLLQTVLWQWLLQRSSG